MPEFGRKLLIVNYNTHKHRFNGRLPLDLFQSLVIPIMSILAGKAEKLHTTGYFVLYAAHLHENIQWVLKQKFL